MPFIKAANCIPGLLISFLVDKSVDSLFSETKLDMTESGLIKYRHWKPASFEKLLRISHFQSLILACMSAPDQEVLWVTDNDAIVPNPDRLIDACSVFEHHANHYLKHKISRMQVCTTNSDNGSLELEDVVALPDLAAGALVELSPLLFAQIKEEANHQVVDKEIKYKAHKVLEWYVDDAFHALKRLLILIWEDENRKLHHRCIHFISLKPKKEYYWFTDFLALLDKE